MVKRSAGMTGYEGFPRHAMAVIDGIEGWLLKHVGSRGLRYFTIALALSVLFNLATLVFIPYPGIVYGILDVLWLTISIFLLTRIYYSHINKNIKYIAGTYGTALVPWAATILLREAVLPFYYNDLLLYYLTGVGFLIGYSVLILGLVKLKRSKQWSLVMPAGNKTIVATGITIAVLAVLFVAASLARNSSRSVDALAFLLFILGDIAIVTLGLKAVNMNIKLHLNYILMALAVSFGITALGDFIQELGWLYSPGPVLSFSVECIANAFYGTSLTFSMLALAFFNTGIKHKALDRISNKLNDTRLFVDDIVMQAPYALVVFDTTGDLVLVNESLLRMFGVKRPDIVRRYNLFSNVIVPGVNVGQATARLKQGKTVVVQDLEYCLPEGKTLNLSVRAFPTFRANGSISNYVVIVEDISDRVRAEKELLDAKTQAELYVDLMGHDLSNIHHIAMGYLEMAGDRRSMGDAPDKGSDELIRTSIDSLRSGSRLIDNVRKLQGEKKGAYPMKNMDIDGVLLGIKRQIDIPAAREITIEYEAGCGRMVVANDLLEDVFINLISNAIKHSTGPLNVIVRTRATGENGSGMCRITIEDDGPGIPDGRKGNIFERMHDDGGMPTGKGLGLYLVKTLVDDYRGQVWVEDRVPGDHTKGARFVVLLAIAE